MVSVNRNVVKHAFTLFVLKIDLIQNNVALKFGIRNRAVAVRMFPRPKVGAFLALGKHAVYLFGVYKSDIALVNLRFLVDKVEHSPRARNTHNDGVNLVGHLIDIVAKLSRHLQERDDKRNAERRNIRADEHADRHIGHVFKNKYAAYCRNDNIQDMPDIAEYGH